MRLWPLALGLVLVSILVALLWLWLGTRWFLILAIAGSIATVGLAMGER